MGHRKISKLSWSALNKFTGWCEYQWYQQYVKQHWPKKKGQPLLFGSAYHIAMKALCSDFFFVAAHIVDTEARMAGSILHAQSQYDFQYGMDGGPNVKKWEPKAHAMLAAQGRQILDLVTFRGFNVIRLQDLEMWVSKDVSIGGSHKFRFNGKLDAIATMGGEFEVLIDWKTSFAPYDEAEAAANMQLVAYQILADRPNAHVAFCVATKPDNAITDTPVVQWLERLPTAEDRAAFQRYAIQTHLRMENTPPDGFEKIKDPDRCKWCNLADDGYCEGVS